MSDDTTNRTHEQSRSLAHGQAQHPNTRGAAQGQSRETNPQSPSPVQPQTLIQPQAHTGSNQGEIANPDAHLSALSRRQIPFVQSIVWDGLPFTHVFQKLGIPERTAYRWMRDPAVLAAIKGEERVLRSSARTGNILALQRIRDSSDNALAVVQAVKALEQLADQEQGTAAPGQSRGYVIVINAPAAAGAAEAVTAQPVDNARIIDVTPSQPHAQRSAEDLGDAFEGGGG